MSEIFLIFENQDLLFAIFYIENFRLHMTREILKMLNERNEIIKGYPPPPPIWFKVFNAIYNNISVI